METSPPSTRPPEPGLLCAGINRHIVGDGMRQVIYFHRKPSLFSQIDHQRRHVGRGHAGDASGLPQAQGPHGGQLFPGLQPQTLPLKGVGEDSISLDPCESTDFPNHLTLLGADLVNTENLTGLEALLGRRFTFVTLPLKLENADGCSCRAIAMED